MSTQDQLLLIGLARVWAEASFLDLRGADALWAATKAFETSPNRRTRNAAVKAAAALDTRLLTTTPN
jgi:hypothetical protein